MLTKRLCLALALASIPATAFAYPRVRADADSGGHGFYRNELCPTPAYRAPGFPAWLQVIPCIAQAS